MDHQHWWPILLLVSPWIHPTNIVTLGLSVPITRPRSRSRPPESLILSNQHIIHGRYRSALIPRIKYGYDSLTRMLHHQPLSNIQQNSSYEETTTSQEDSSSISMIQRRVRDDNLTSMNIVKSFIPSKYNPYLFLRNPHIQTILGVFLRRNSSCAYIPKQPRNSESETKLQVVDEFQEALELIPLVSQSIITGLVQYFIQSNNNNDTISRDDSFYWDERERIDTTDGDFFHVDYKWNSRNYEEKEQEEESKEKTKKKKKIRHLVVILHGLESSSNSPLRFDLTEAFHQYNFDVAFINFRGCSGVPNETLGSYHAGFTDDLILFLSIIRKRYGDDVSIYLSGFSLGSNVVIKCLGDLGIRARAEFNIQGAAVMACPFDLNIQYRRLVDDPFNRFLYNRTILRKLKEKAIYKLYKHCDGDENTSLFDYKKCRHAKTIVEIEEGLIVPAFGFQDKFDYYNKSASISVMKNIVVPSLVINAADDPFFDSTYFPWSMDCDRGGGSAPIKLMRTEFGGHLGYIFHVMEHEVGVKYPPSSWICNELARFAKHVREFTNSHL